MKNAIKKFFSFLLAIILAIVIAIPFLVVIVVLIPFDYVKYKRSVYYKTTKKKYSLFDASSQNFKLYNKINERALPIRFLHHPTEEESMVYGWFVFEKTLIILNVFGFEYDQNSEKWSCSIEDEESEESARLLLSIDEYIETEIEEVNKALNEEICDKAVVLIDADCLEDAENAYKEERFLVYKDDDDMMEKLSLLCNKKNEDPS